MQILVIDYPFREMAILLVALVKISHSMFSSLYQKNLGMLKIIRAVNP